VNYKLFIAIRYLFSKKRHNTINLITWVSMMGVAIGTMALIAVLSVVNGFERFVQDSFSAFDPSLKILPREGKAFLSQDSLLQKAKALKIYTVWCEVIEQDGLIAFKDQQTPAIIKGVDYNYGNIINSETIMWDGSMDFNNSYDNQNLAAIGIGMAEHINSGVDLVQPLTLYAPKNRKVNLARPDANFTQTTFYNNGIFCVMQPKYDDNLVVMSIDLVREAYQLTEDYVTSIEVKCADEKIQSIKKHRKGILLVSAGRSGETAAAEMEKNLKCAFTILNMELAGSVLCAHTDTEPEYEKATEEMKMILRRSLSDE
jgi:lipoprotein-releasing system permease protein